MSKLKKIAYSLPLSLPEFDHDTTRKASSLQTKLPNGHEKFDEFGGEQLYEKFFDILKTQGKVVLENTIQSYQETDEGAKLISNLKFYVDNCGVEEPEHAVISGIITKTTKKKLRRRSEKETLNPTLPDSFIKLDKTEENQDNTHTKSFNHFFLPTPEQQREVQLEAENLFLKEQIAELEKQLEETKAVLDALIEENRLRFEQIKVLELRVEEAESASKSLKNSQKEYIPIADRAPQVAPKLYEDREIDPETGKPITILQFLERYYGEYLTKFNPELEVDLLYQDQLGKLDKKALMAYINSIHYRGLNKQIKPEWEKINELLIKPKKERTKLEIFEDAKNQKDAIRILRTQAKYKSLKKHFILT